jgi:hypothetical protein
MAWASDLKGVGSTNQNSFGIGGPSGPKLHNTSGNIELRDTTDVNLATGRAARIIASGAAISDLPTLLDLMGNLAVIEFAFDGATPPDAGDNTAKFGFVHTTGGGFTAGQVVYDTGTALLLLPTEVAKHLTTALTVTGTISLINNGLYSLDNGSWILKGDGNATSEGTLRVVEVAYSHADTTKSSTTAIPTGARIVRVSNNVMISFAGGTGARTLQVVIDGATIDTEILAVADSDLSAAAENYVKEAVVKVDGTIVEPGVVKLTVTVPSGHSAGVGALEVFYVSPNA